ncbi:MAG: DUF4347 domain-containing protein [Magnetococcus sp. THC-1_WYH]
MFMKLGTQRVIPPPDAKPTANVLMVLTLEPRVLLDAAVMETVADTVQPDLTHEDFDEGGQNHGAVLLNAVQEIAASTALPNTAPPNEVLFMDASVAGADSLLSDLRDGVEVVLLESGRNGLDQIAEALKGRSGLEAIHIVSHGKPGQVSLGTASLSLASLEANRSSLETIGSALAEGGDLLFYGCDVGKGDAGSLFVGALAGITGANVAASDDPTGSTAMGGDWDLETQNGVIEAELPSFAWPVTYTDLLMASQATRVQASDAESLDQFGDSVSISGNYAIVGAPYESSGGSKAGAAYFFKTTDNGATWSQTAKIQSNDIATNDIFGYKVSISGDLAIIGANGDNSNMGAAYIFKTSDSGDTWTQTAKLTASDGAGFDYFGSGVAISGNYALVGAYGEDTTASNAGSAYFFKTSDGGNTWIQTAEVQVSDAAGGDLLGSQMAISGDIAILGVPTKDSSRGAAYVFITGDSGDSWTQVAKLTSADLEAGDQFGSSVFINESDIIVGSPSEASGGSNAGAAYVFHTNDGGSSWTQTAKLTASDAQGADFFGISASIDGDYAVVGSRGESTMGPNVGSAYVFKTSDGGSTWTQLEKFQASGGTSTSVFGNSVAISGDNVLVGAMYEKFYTGAAYFFTGLSTSAGTPTDIALSNSTVAENIAGATVGTLSATNAASFAIVYDANNLFEISGTSLKLKDSVTLDYEASKSRNVSIRVTDTNGATFAETLTVNVANVNEDPIDISLSSHEVAAGTAGATVGTLSARDTDSGDTATFSMITDASGLFEISGTTLKIKDGASVNYDSASSSYDVTIRLTDSGALTYDETLTIDVHIPVLTKVQASDAQTNDGFGTSVAVSGNYAIVGALNEDTGGVDAGAAYIFTTGDSGATWTQVAQLFADDPESYDNFGVSVAISGDTAIVGSKTGGNSMGSTNVDAAYIFKTSDNGVTWTQVAKIVSDDIAPGDQFGTSVALSGDYAIVGAPGESAGGWGAGAAYIFRTSDNGATWTQVAKIMADDAEANDHFGLSVALSGNYAIVGTPYESEADSYAGAAYVFETNDSGATWVQTAKIISNDIESNDQFGYSVALSGDYAIIGAPYEDEAGLDAGAAYVFKTNDSGATWTQTSKIMANNAHDGDTLGWSVYHPFQ